MNNNIIERLERIEAKLDAVIKALHEYDDDIHNVVEWDEERMDIIGQNGNEGLHYIDIDGNEFSDYGQRIAKEVMSDENNIRVSKDKSNNTQPKQKQYYKNKHSKRNNNKN